MLKSTESLLKTRRKAWKKIVATMLVITLTIANFILLGITAISSVSYAAGDLEVQNNTTQSENVKFDAYFVKDKQKMYFFIQEALESTQLYLHLNVTNEGFLKDASIEIRNANYNITGQLDGSDIIETINGQTIELKQVNYRN